MINPWRTEIGRLFLFYVVFMSWTTMQAREAFSDVLISEVCPDPASDWSGNGEIDTRGDEWIEVVNTSPELVDLSAYWIRDALGTAPQLRLSGTLSGGAVAWFTGDDALAWQEASGEGSSGLSLNNSGDTVELFLGHPEEEGSTRVDVLFYDSHIGVDDRSLARFLPEDEWVLCDGLNPYGGDLEPLGTGCSPTPGLTNSCEGLVAAEQATWSDIKSLWH
jgi:hypothetical protein